VSSKVFFAQKSLNAPITVFLSVICLAVQGLAQTGPNAPGADDATAPVATAASDGSSPDADTSPDGAAAPDAAGSPAGAPAPAGQAPRPRSSASTQNKMLPPQVAPAPGVTTQPLNYRNGDIAASIGTPSLSERFNQLLPPWLRFSGEIRDRVEGYENAGFKPNSSDFYDLYRLRLGMLVQPDKWIRFFIETEDDRAFEKYPQIPPYQDTWDISKAYVEIGSSELNGFSLRAGRQELYFGNGRFIGNSWWSNTMRKFDAIRGIYQNQRFRVDLFASSVVINRDGVINHHNPGNNLYGAYGTIKNPVPKSQLEPFVFWHVQSGATLKSGKLGHLDQWTTGVRFLGSLPAGFDYRTEMAIQRGELGPSDITAWTGHWVVGKTFRDVFLTPRPFVEYNFASGDNNPKDMSETSTFDPIYPSTHDKIGLADQVGWRNVRDLRFGLDIRPTKKWALNTDFHDLWLADAKDSLYPTRGAVVAKDPTGASGTHIGEEFDIQAIYKPTLQWQAGVGFGRLFTGEFLNKTTKGKDYSYPYVLFDYVF